MVSAPTLLAGEVRSHAERSCATNRDQFARARQGTWRVVTLWRCDIVASGRSASWVWV